jgi:hypothetical protein
MATNATRRVKDPDATLDYRFDWAPLTNERGRSDWLASGETITDHEIVAEAGLTVDSSSITDTGTSVTVWLSDGTAGNDYDVTCRVTTSAGRVDDRTLVILCRER